MTMLIPIRDHNPYRRFPLVTVLLVAANVLIFLAVGISDRVAFRYGAIPCDLIGRCPALSGELVRTFPDRSVWETIFSSMFMHGSLLHLGGNMLYLWVFGNNVEDRLGSIGYTVFYFVCGVAAAAAHITANLGSDIPIIGASGAVSGVLGAYFWLFPKARVVALVPMLLFFTVEVSAKFLLGLWFVMQLLSSLAGIGSTGDEAGVAFLAHVGGFVAGYVITRLMHPQRTPPRPQRLDEWLRS